MIRLNKIFFLLFFINIIAYPSLAQYPDTLDKKRLHTVIAVESGVYVSGLSFLSFVWYKDHERVPFHWYNDAKGYLQMDKAGHAFAAYWESYAAYHALRSSGIDKRKALLYGGSIGLFFQTPVEIFDGLYEGWGFSWPDMAANTFGSLLLISQEAFFDEQIFHMKFSYSPSGYPKYHDILGETPVESFFLDYNGHTYWLSGNVKRLTCFEKIPPWINIAFGYSGNGMIKEFENPEFYNGEPFPYLPRYRQFILSPDIDLSKIPTKKKWLHGLLSTLNVLKIPFPAIEYNKIEGIILRPLYY